MKPPTSSLILAAFLLVFSACTPVLPSPGLQTIQIPTEKGIDPVLEGSTPPAKPLPDPTETPGLGVAATFSPSVESNLAIHCAEFLPGEAKIASAPGKIILRDWDGKTSPGRTLYQFDLQTGEMSVITEHASGFNPSVSPDQNLLAFQELKPNDPEGGRLVIINKDGERTQEFPWQSAWGGIVDWFDNEQLLLWGQEGIPASTILFNPFSTQQKSLSADLPGIYDLHPPLYTWGKYSMVEAIYAPNLSLVLYPAVKAGETNITLWNLENNELITEFGSGTLYGGHPVWSANGDQFLVNLAKSNRSHSPETASEEIFLANIKGETKQLTHLLDTFKETHIVNFTWSPDEKFVAFLVFVKPFEYPVRYEDIGGQNYPGLAVYDTETGQTTLMCIPVDSVLPLIWSPDSSQLVLTYQYNSNQVGENVRVYVVDVLEKFALEIAKNMQPVGWMVK